MAESVNTGATTWLEALQRSKRMDRARLGSESVEGTERFVIANLDDIKDGVTSIAIALGQEDALNVLASFINLHTSSAEDRANGVGIELRVVKREPK